ncbi:related to C6 finger domain [Lecanosticta acicola]|uniref:Related to C6 finger domain n=1 Tax=Lecanosticta acicola TaxID=111012 RepID=A0AAI8Z4E7_9PEZI|nr:related to C6 finger domain [Lecanosticta acicola]
MPKAHTTPALHLLHWPVIQDLVSKPCNPQALMQLEMSRPPLHFTREFEPDWTDPIEVYVKAFFEKANVWYAVVSPYAWRSYYQSASSVNVRSGAESCIVLLVLALGKAAHSHLSISELPPNHPPPGLSYFYAAWSLLPSLLLRSDVLSAQAHILAAAYLLYLVRPLEAWNALCTASSKIQLLLSSPTTIPPQLRELAERIYWNTLLIESDLLAELDLPHTGIVSFEESMRLPRSFPYDTTVPDSPGTDDIWYFLAEIAIRRLLNRVSHLIYSQKQQLGNLEPIVTELDYQLTQWYTSLPPSVRFPRERTPARNQIQTVLRLRYFACRTIIFRPYIQAVLHEPSLINEPGVKAACEKCSDACIRQLENISVHREGHLPYLWQGALSITSQSLLLMGATLSPVLSGLLPLSKQETDAVIADVVAEIEGLAHLAPSLKLCAEIVREAEERRQFLMQRPKT